MTTVRPLLALTMGDIAGISPEIVASALVRTDARALGRVVVIGDAAALERGLAVTGTSATINRIDDVADAVDQAGTIDLIQPGDPIDAPVGTVSAAAGGGAVDFVRRACALGRDGAIDGIVTAPLNKAAMHAAGHRYPGHTELLAEEFGVDDFSLVLAAEDLAVFHVTTHVGLREAVDQLTRDRLLRTLRLADAFARASGDEAADIAVMGLNPHAGEGGLFGDEEAAVMEPALADARAAGLSVTGPLPGDAAFPQAVAGRWHYLVACYHDQGHIPFKTYFGDDGVNITAGLPVVRVSVDHGTAFDIAGQGIARDDSLVLAIRRAAELAPGWGAIWGVSGGASAGS